MKFVYKPSVYFYEKIPILLMYIIFFMFFYREIESETCQSY